MASAVDCPLFRHGTARFCTPTVSASAIAAARHARPLCTATRLPGQRRAQRRRALAALRCGRDGRRGLAPDLPQPLSPHTAISVPPALWRSLSDLSQRSSRCARPPSPLPYLYCACAQVEALRQPPLPTQLETWQHGQGRRWGGGRREGSLAPRRWSQLLSRWPLSPPVPARTDTHRSPAGHVGNTGATHATLFSRRCAPAGAVPGVPATPVAQAEVLDVRGWTGWSALPAPKPWPPPCVGKLRPAALDSCPLLDTAT